ncbi:MAG: hypothetical protein WC711_00950 [Candidatus Staskawiczbacteria bacterium]|jgi:hypothetical protein
MNSRNVFSILMIVTIFLVAGAVYAVAPNQLNSVKYTEAQKKCIKIAQEKMANALKPAREAMQNATKDVLKIKQNAISAAQKLTDQEAKKVAIKAANEAYNNNPVVKKAKIPYSGAVKVANEQFKKDQKNCLSESPFSPNGFLKNIRERFSNFGQGIEKFFTGRK